MTNPRYCLWLDFETNGDSLTSVEVPEIAWALTTRDDPGFPIIAMGHYLVRLSRVGYENMPAIVAQMHKDSGLLNDLETKDTIPAKRLDLVDAMMFNEVYGKVPENAEVILAGAGVSHFDNTILRGYFPLVYNGLHGYNSRETGYLKQTMDVSIFGRFMESFGYFVPRPGHPDVTMPLEWTKDGAFYASHMVPHRAMYDVLYAIGTARYFKRQILNWETQANRLKFYLDEVKRESESD